MTIITNCLLKRISSATGKNYFTIFLFVCLTAFQTTGSAQTVNGTVTDETGKPVSYASVVIKNTQKGTTTDNNGMFSIAASPGDVLVVSSLGHATKEIKVASENNLSISLISTNSQLS